MAVQVLPPEPKSLTTVFKPPPSCNWANIQAFTTFTSCDTATNSDSSTNADACWATLGPECYPYSITDNARLAQRSYSPGVCPLSFYAAASAGAPNGPQTSWCCPNDMYAVVSTIDELESTFCANVITGSFSATVFPTSIATFETYRDETTTQILEALTTYETKQTNVVVNIGVAVAGSELLVRVHPVVVAWASSDLASFSPASAPVRGSITPTPTATATASGGATDGTSGVMHHGTKDRSVNTHAAIAACLVIAGLLLLGVLVWLLRRRRVPSRKYKRQDKGPYIEIPEQHLLQNMPGRVYLKP